LKLKAVSGSAMTLLFLGMLTLAFHVQPARTELGRAIDLYTQSYRWPGYTANYTGQNVHGGEAAPLAAQDQICLFANVTYNGYEIANLLVSFQICGPPNAIQNVTIYSTGFTNASGIAQVCFRVSPDPNVTLGEWFVNATVGIDGEVVWDSVSFKVVRMGDVNGDGSVDVLDLIVVAKALDTYPGDPKYNPNADINGDGELDVLDLVLVAKCLGT
jgi:hypothetical protein